MVLDIGAALVHSGVGWLLWRWRLLVRWWSADLVFRRPGVHYLILYICVVLLA
jgi:hypothetical protein